MATAPGRGWVQHFRVQGVYPPFPKRKYSGDAALDVFAPTEIRIRPGERVTVDTSLACAFPKGTWCLLKEKSGLAHCYRVMLLGGVIDGNYRGWIRAILANIGHETVVIPHHAAFCQRVLLPTDATSLTPRPVDLHGERGTDGGVNRELARDRRAQGNGGWHGPGTAAGHN